jgi:peptide/nickel transport system substrate-binding protein
MAPSNRSGHQALPAGFSRRDFIRSSALVGLSVGGAGWLLTGCGGSSSSAKISTKLLRLHLDEDISNLDPALSPGHTNTTIRHNIFQGLVTFLPSSFELVNVLASEFKPSGDGLRFDFTLKQGIPFHGGYGEVTAEDVKFSYERIAGLTRPKLDTPNQSDWAALKGVEVHDKYSGTIVLKEPFAPLLVTTLPFASGEIVSKKAVEERGEDFGTHPIGTGPYEFVEWKRDQHVLLKKFADYGGAADYTPAPQWEQLKFVVISEANPTAIALETGELDFAVLDPESVDRVSRNEDFDIVEKTTLDYNWIGINTAHPNFKNKDVRLAVIHGIDVESIMAGAFDGKWERATALVAPGMPLGYWKNAPKYKRNVATAKAYLAKAGAEGTEIEMSVSDGVPGATTVAEIVQQNLNEVGFNVKVLVQESGVFGQATPEANAEKQLFYMGFTTKPDPSWSTTWFTCDQVGEWNWMSWCSEEYTRMHEEALTETDPAKRNEMYIKMQELMDDDAIALWVSWPTAFVAVRKGLTAAIRPDGDFLAWAFRANA